MHEPDEFMKPVLTETSIGTRNPFKRGAGGGFTQMPRVNCWRFTDYQQIAGETVRANRSRSVPDPRVKLHKIQCPLSGNELLVRAASSRDYQGNRG
jgi:hypothetical protein